MFSYTYKHICLGTLKGSRVGELRCDTVITGERPEYGGAADYFSSVCTHFIVHTDLSKLVVRCANFCGLNNYWWG